MSKNTATAPSPSVAAAAPTARPRLTPYFYYNTSSGQFESGNAVIDASFLASHSATGWKLQPLAVGTKPPHPLTHTVDPATGTPALMETPIAESALSVSGRQKSAQVTMAAANLIGNNGFLSTALSPSGQSTPEAYFYPSDDTSQRNHLMGGLVLCRAPDGTWARRPHTDAQMQQVRADFVTMRDSVLTQLDTVRATLSAATTIDQVAAVTFSDSAVAQAARTAVINADKSGA